MNACDKIMTNFLQLDKNERLPLSITLHLLVCKKCRTEVRLCSLAEKVSAKPLNATLPLDDSTFSSIMQALNSSVNSKKVIKTVDGQPFVKPVTFSQWIIAGILMIFAFCFYGINSEPLSFQSISVPFYLVFGIVLTTYCILFVRGNMDFFVKKFMTTNQAS